MEWRGAPDFPGYEVSEKGDVRRSEPARGGRVGRILRSFPKSSGHRDIVLRRDGRHVHARVARLVCEAWHGPCPDGQECCHADGNPSNDHFSNLRWDTRSANHLDKVRHGTHLRGENSLNAKLTWREAFEIRERYAAGGITMKLLAEHYEVGEPAIFKIVHNKRWVPPSF